MAANRSFVATWFPFEGRSIKACEVRCSRDNQSDQKRGDNDRRDEPAYNFVALRPARGTPFILPPGDCCRWSSLNVGKVCHARIWVRQ